MESGHRMSGSSNHRAVVSIINDPITNGSIRQESGVTLLEMLVVVALVAVITGITFPSVVSALDSIRLASAADSIVGFLNAGIVRAQRRQDVIEVTIDKKANAILLDSTDPGFHRRLDMPSGITIAGVVPELPATDTDSPRRFLLYPGGTVPGFGVELADAKGIQRIVRVDPITGVPKVEHVTTQ